MRESLLDLFILFCSWFPYWFVKNSYFTCRKGASSFSLSQPRTISIIQLLSLFFDLLVFTDKNEHFIFIWIHNSCDKRRIIIRNKLMLELFWNRCVYILEKKILLFFMDLIQTSFFNQPNFSFILNMLDIILRLPNWKLLQISYLR